MLKTTCSPYRPISASLFIALTALIARAEQPKATTERLRPSGIEGTVMVVGDGDVPDVVKKRFFGYAGSEKATLVVVLPKTADEAARKSVAAEWEEKKPAAVTVLTEDAGRLSQAVHAATGIWLEAGGVLAEDLRDVVKRSGTVACVGKSTVKYAAEILPWTTFALANDHAADEAKRLAGPGRPSIVVENGTAVAIKRRDIRVMGNGKIYS